MKTATNKQTGEQVALINNQWVPIERTATNKQTGEKAYLVSGNWMTDKSNDAPQSAPQQERPEEDGFWKKAANTLTNVYGAPAEVAANLISSIIAKPVSEVMAMSAAATGADDPEGFKQSIRDKLTYEPRTELGKDIVESPVNPINVIGKVVGGVSGAARDLVADEDAPEDSVRNMAANAIEEAIPQLLAVYGAKGQLPPGVKATVNKLKSGYDWLQKRRPAVKIMNEITGKDTPAITAALEKAPADLSAAQALKADPNVPQINDVFDALGEFAKKRDTQNFFSRNEAAQRTAMVNEIRSVAGRAANQTEANWIAKSTQRELNNILQPLREAELGAADTAGTIGTKLQRDVNQLESGASGRVADVRRLEGAKTTAEGLAKSGQPRLDTGAPPIAGLPRVPARYTYPRELANLAERFSQKAADDSVMLGEARRFKQMQLDSLAAHGLKPLESGRIISNLQRKLKNPKIGVEDINKRVLTKGIKKLEEWTRADGVISAEALYGIRKSAVNSAIEQFMGTAKPKAKAKRAAGLLREVKPLIDDAIEQAGGTRWRTYLNLFETGMTNVRQLQMGAKALELFEKQPKKLESLVAGNEPKIVEKIFETTDDFDAAMGKKAEPIRKIAEQVKRDRLIKEGAARGEGGLTRIFEEHKAKWKLPNWINAKIAVTNKALDIAASRINEAAMLEIYEAMRTGKGAAALLKGERLKKIPSKQRKIITDAILKGTYTAEIAAPAKRDQELQ